MIEVGIYAALLLIFFGVTFLAYKSGKKRKVVVKAIFAWGITPLLLHYLLNFPGISMAMISILSVTAYLFGANSKQREKETVSVNSDTSVNNQ